MTVADDDATIQNLLQFQFGDLPDGAIAMLLSYAASPEKLAKREFDSFVIGMTREKAIELATSLLAHAKNPPRQAPPTARH